MNRKLGWIILACAASLAQTALSQSSSAVIANLATAKWTHDATDPIGAESVTLREDPQTGGLEMLVRYPAGHVFQPHWHSSNERILLIEGRVTLRRDGSDVVLYPGGFAFLPAKEVQRMSCTSKTRCTFYLYWDGKPDFHPVK
jgi:quercetin dioxygenase-like cupin family protein